MGTLKIGVALWSLGIGKTQAEFEAVLDLAVAAGVRGVQIWCVDEPTWDVVCHLDPDRCATPQARAAVRAACERRGLTITGLCGQLAAPDALGGFGEADRGLAARIDKTRKALRLAADLGAPIVSTHVGAVPHHRDSPIYARFVANLRAVLRDSPAVLACETGLEPAAVLKRFIEDVGSPDLKVNFDPANMLAFGCVESVEMLAPYIVHTHAKDKNTTTGSSTVGAGAVPWDRYIAALGRIGYGGWYAIEDESGRAGAPASVLAGRTFLERF